MALIVLREANRKQAYKNCELCFFNEEYQPFRKYIGCTSPGFEAIVLWFLACVEATPDTVENIKLWKKHACLIKETLSGGKNDTGNISESK